MPSDDIDSLLKARAGLGGDVDALLTQRSGEAATPARRALQPPQELSMMERLAAMVPSSIANNAFTRGARGTVMGMADPTVGTAQLLANLMPESTGVPQMYNKAIADKEAAYRSERMVKPQQGLQSLVTGVQAEPSAPMDLPRMAGNMLSPANLAMALRAPVAATTTGRAIQGGVQGLVGGATAPVEVGESGKFWQPKAVQAVIGAGAGTILNPVVGMLGDKIAARINKGTLNPARAASEADDMVNAALKEANQKIEDVPVDQLAHLRRQVTTALSEGKNLDVAAALRKADFEAEGIKPTLGWVTRDPMQFAAEKNIRGITGLGEPLMARMEGANADLMGRLGQYSQGAQERDVASKGLAQALRNYGEGRQAGVGAKYTAARESTGKDLEIPMQGLAQDYAEISKGFDLPGGVKRSFEQYGLLTGKQGKTFNFEDADKLRKVLSENTDPKNPVLVTALGRLRESLDKAQENAAAGGGPFAPAVKEAAGFFKEKREIPALAAAMSGDVDDNFVRTFVTGSRKTEEVQKLAALLRKESPEAFEQTRQQIGETLATAAFGTNKAGDKTVAQEAYNRALKQIGTGKLSAFFEPAEVEQLKRLGRLGTYMEQPPSGAAVNFSNTAGTLANILRSGANLPFAKQPLERMAAKVDLNQALSAKVPITSNLTDQQRTALSRLLSAGSGGAGVAAAGIIGQ